MSYDGLNNLNQLSTANPLNGASQAELAEAIREVKTVLKNVLLAAHTPNGALRGVNANTLNPNSVGTEQIVDESVTTAKILALAITEALIAAGAVTTVKLADGSVTGPKLAPGAVTSAAYAEASIPLTALAQVLTGLYIGSSASDDSLRAIGSNHIKDVAILDRCIAAMAVTKLTGGTEGQIAVRGASGWSAVTPAGGLTYNTTTGLFSITSPASAAHFGDLKSRGSSGGGSIASTWVTRDLGEIEDGRELMTFIGNTFKLVTGSYYFYARCPVAGAVGKHQARLFRDNADSTNEIVLWGTSEQSATHQSGASIVQGTLLVENANHVFKLEHWAENTVATSGFGLASSSDNTVVYGNHTEVYTTGYLLRLT
jgi:hypothetical protein